MRILVNTPSGRQSIEHIEATGDYFDKSRVLWDERVDGPLPEVTLGGMVRAGQRLAFSQSRMNQEPPPIQKPLSLTGSLEALPEDQKQRIINYLKTV